MQYIVVSDHMASTTAHSSVPLLRCRPATHSSHENIDDAWPWYRQMVSSRSDDCATSSASPECRHHTAADLSAIALLCAHGHLHRIHY